MKGRYIHSSPNKRSVSVPKQTSNGLRTEVVRNPGAIITIITTLLTFFRVLFPYLKHTIKFVCIVLVVRGYIKRSYYVYKIYT